MKPMISDRALRDSVVKELRRDPEVAAKHVSVIAVDKRDAAAKALGRITGARSTT